MRLMAWSNGERVNVVPSVWKEVDDYGKTLDGYHKNLKEGDELIYPCTIIREECHCREYEADRYWERGMQVAALEQMMGAASRVLPDESVGFVFEDVQWLDPKEMVYWHPNVLEFLRLMRRCEGYCKQNPRLWSLLEDSWNYRAYRRYLSTLRTVGYRELFPVLDGTENLQSAIQNVKLNTWHYARKQLTWMRRYQ